MALTLHQQLKDYYVRRADRHEVRLGDFRIDAVDHRGRLIEIQCAPLSAIRDKIRQLVETHKVIVVKPLAARKRITTLHGPGGEVAGSRFSPARQSLSHVFKELVHFGVFPHPGLQLDVLLTEQEEFRIPPNARSSWRRKFRVEDRTLVAVHTHVKLKTAADLWNVFDFQLPSEFTTAELAVASNMPLWLAQKAAFCFRRMGFLDVCGKNRNSILYRLAQPGRRRRAA